MATKKSFLRQVMQAIGPGFITGAADDDPSGIGTYAQTGAQFGFGQLWLSLFAYPFMTAIQESCGRIGLVTGKGLSGVIKTYYSRKILLGAVCLLLVANIINIGADLGAMAASVQLLVPIPFLVLLVAITAFTLLVEIYVPYPTYARFLKYLTISLFAYIAVAFIVKQDWSMVLRETVLPTIHLSRAYLFNIAAMLGTTISPYLFFWQADEEVEEEIVKHEIRGIGKGVPKIRRGDLRQMRIDTSIGMLFSQIITFFVIISVASTLYASGIHNVTTAAQAAKALQPLAGNLAFLLFALGIVGTGLLAIPVLAGSAGYAVAEAFNWTEGLGKKFSQAHGFYGIIAAATLIGLIVNFLPISPITMLYYAAILNGVLAPPLMILLLLIGNNKKILGVHTNSRLSNILCIAITVIMSCVAVSLL